ncbi:MAG: hypothetical protein ACYDBX_04445 [Patescibacteria group bacterium]
MQVSYFPYLQLKNEDEIDVGNVKIWKFNIKSEEYIKDIVLREKVKKMLYTNTFDGKPIEDIAIISIGNIDFREFSEKEINQINEVKYILFIAFLSINNIIDNGPNKGHYMATSENFEIISQSFDLKNDTITTNNGFIVKKIDFGNKISDIKFEYPLYVPRPLVFTIDKYFVKQVLILKIKHKVLYKRILSAVEMFYESYYNNPSVSLGTRILLQAGAFETLLSNSPDEFRKAFKQEIAKMLCIRGGERRISFMSERNNKKKREEESIKVMWGDRFFTLRNHIIHGNNLNPKEFKFRNIQWHFHIAPIFFIAFIHQSINNTNKDKGETIFSSRIDWVEPATGNIRGFEFTDNTSLYQSIREIL